MKPIILKSLIEKEVYFSMNLFTELADLEKSSPQEYGVISAFFQKCKEDREMIEQLKKERDNFAREVKEIKI